MRMRVALLGCLGIFITSTLRADLVVGSSGAGWQTWQATSPTNSDSGPGSNEFWDNQSWDGRRCNIGYWLTGAATGCSNSVYNGGLPASEAPGQIEFWGQSRSTNDSSFYFTSEGSHSATLRIEVAGNRNYNAFGWYDLGSPSTLHELFDGGDSPTAISANFSPVGNYGFYFTDKSGNTYRTSQKKDSKQEQRFALFRESPHTKGNEADVFWLGLEDLPLANSDRDYNDLVVRVSAVPEPAAFVVLGVGLLGIYMKRRRKVLPVA